MTRKEVLRLFQISARTLRRWVVRGKFPAPLDCNGIDRWRAFEVQRFQEERERQKTVRSGRREAAQGTAGTDQTGPVRSETDTSGQNGTDTDMMGHRARGTKKRLSQAARVKYIRLSRDGTERRRRNREDTTQHERHDRHSHRDT